MTVSALRARELRSWRNAILAVFVLLGLSFGSWLSRIPAVRDHLDASSGEMSIIALALAIGSVVGLVLSNKIVLKLGPRRTLRLFLILQCVSMPLSVLALWVNSVPAALGLLFCFGFSFSNSDVAVNVTGAANERGLRKPQMPLFHAGYSLGAVAAMGVGSLMEALQVGFVPHIIGTFAVVAGAALFCVRSIPRDEGRAWAAEAAAAQEEDRAATDTLAGAAATTATGSITLPGKRTSVWLDKRILLVGLLALSMSLSEGAASDWLPLAMVDGLGANNQQGAIFLGIFLTTMTLTRLAGSWLLQRFGRVAVIRVSVCIAVVGMLLVIFGTALPVAFVGSGLWGIGVALGFPVGMSAAADNPARATESVAAVAAIAYMAYLVGPVTIGFLGDLVGLQYAFIPALIVLLIGGLVSGVLRNPETRTTVPSHPRPLN